LDTIRAIFDWLHRYPRRGVWRLLDCWDLSLRSARAQQYSPDPEYGDKVANLEISRSHRPSREPTLC
jgi:hypothetical protein